MAKRKKAKKEKIVDLKPEKISDEHLKEVQSIVNEINRGQMEVGILSTRQHNILHNVAELQDKLTLLQDTFQNQYGTWDINILDGTINYQKENGEADKKN
jgi:hypothetical protein